MSTGVLDIRTAFAVLVILSGALFVALSGTAVAGRSAPPTSRDAARFLTTVIRQLAANDYADAWRTLHPVDQALVPLNAYVECESKSPVPGRPISTRTLSIGHEPVALTTSRPIVPSIVVRFRLLIAGPGPFADVPVQVRAHAILFQGQWRWMLPPARLIADQSCAASRG